MSARAGLFALAALAAGLAARAGDPSDHAEAAEWTVRVGSSVAGSGAASAVELHLTSRAGYHVNLDYPMAFRPTPGSTVTFREARVPLSPKIRTPCQGRAQESCAVTLDLPYTAPEKVQARLAGTLAFSVCSAERCLIEKVSLLASLAPVRPGDIP
jgi:hypothetical protein